MVQMSLEVLAGLGAFSGAPVEKTVTWKQGAKEVSAVVYVRRLGYQSAVSDLKAGLAQSDPVAGRIAACICDQEGKPIFRPEDITGEADPARGPLDGNLTMALLAAIADVNDLGKAQPDSN